MTGLTFFSILYGVRPLTYAENERTSVSSSMADVDQLAFILLMMSDKLTELVNTFNSTAIEKNRQNLRTRTLETFLFGVLRKKNYHKDSEECDNWPTEIVNQTLNTLNASMATCDMAYFSSVNNVIGPNESNLVKAKYWSNIYSDCFAWDLTDISKCEKARQKLAESEESVRKLNEDLKDLTNTLTVAKDHVDKCYSNVTKEAKIIIDKGHKCR